MDGISQKINSEICCEPNYLFKTFSRWLSLTGISIILVFITIYIIVSRGKQYLLDNWQQYKNNPLIMPFAGIIKNDSSLSTSNFTDYILSIMEKIVKIMLKPVLFIFKLIIKSIKEIVKTLNNFRNFAGQLRKNVLTYFNSLEQRINDAAGTLQFTLLKFFDMLGKASGMLTISKYLLATVAFTLKSIIDVIGSIVKTLIVIAISIFGILMLIGGPFIWGILGSLSMLANGVGESYCFDEDTPIKLNNGKFKKIKDIQYKDILYKNTKIIGIIKTLACKNNIYNYKNIKVTGDHTVFENNKWIRVADSIFSKKITNFEKDYLYCLITHNNKIPVNDIIFGDYCEINDKKSLTTINNYILNRLNSNTNITQTKCSRAYDGLFGNTRVIMGNGKYKQISEIKINDIIKGGIVTATIKINLEKVKLYNYKGSIVTGGIIILEDKLWKKCCDTNNKKINYAENITLYHISSTNGNILLDNGVIISDFSEIKDNCILEKIDLFALNIKNKSKKLHSF